jgi:Glyoxalase-like domain
MTANMPSASLSFGDHEASASSGRASSVALSRARCLRIFLASVLLCLVGVSVAAGSGVIETNATPTKRPLVRIDHIPLAVHDVEAAAVAYRRLGFTIKPGRFHSDGIRNMHVKFANGAGIELITASAPTDDLTRRYLALLAQGEGPAFVGFYTPDLRALEQRLNQSGTAYTHDDNTLVFNDRSLAWSFMFDVLNLAPNEKAEYFRHSNTANATLGIWIAGGDQSRIVELFKVLGAPVERRKVYVPDPVLAEVATVADAGEVILLPATRQILPGRPIVGIVFQVQDLNALNRTIDTVGVIPALTRETNAYRSTFIAPRDTHGVWLEFREPR